MRERVGHGDRVREGERSRQRVREGVLMGWDNQVC